MFNEAFIGLDLDRQAVKGVRVERRWKRVTVVQADTLRLPPAGGDVAAIVGRWMDSLGWRDLPCVTSVPGHTTILKNLELAPGDPRTLRQVAALEVHRLAEMTGESFTHDLLELKPGPAGQARALLFVIRGQALETALTPLTAMGLNVIDVTPASLALFNLLTWAGRDRDSVTVGIVIGHGTTEVVVGARAGVRFVRSFELGVQAFTEALAHARQIPPAQAMDNLFDATVNLGAPAGTGPFPAPLADVTHSWLGEVAMSLDLYRDRYPDPADAPHVLVPAGEGAHMSGLSDVLARQTGLTPHAVRIPAPGGGALAEPHHYAVATGLALKGAGVDASPISLAPPPVRDRRKWRRDRWFWMGALAGVACLAGALMVRHARAQVYRDKSTALEQRTLERTSRLREQWLAVKSENEKRLARLRDLYAVVRTRHVTVGVLTALTAAKAPSDWITVIGSSPATNAIAVEPGTLTNGWASLEPLREFSVQGYTPDASFYSVRTMIRAMKKNEQFRAVDLLEESSPPPSAEEWAVLRCVPFTLRIVVGDDLQGMPPLPLAGHAPEPALLWELREALHAQTVLSTNLESAWASARQAFSTFKQREDAFNVPVEGEAALIDFRVALMETRRKLDATAQQRNMVLPVLFGSSEAAGLETDVRVLFYQLTSIRILAEMALKNAVSTIESIEPLPAVDPPAGGMTNRWVKYPVRMVVTGRYGAMEGLIRDAATPRHFLALRAIRMERSTIANPDSIRATIETAALVFQETTNTEASPEAKRGAF